MDLDRLQLVLRQRSVNETLDLGLRMLQRWSGPVYRAWFAFVIPACLLILGLAAAAGHTWLGLLFIWWLRPIWDRVPLFVLSRAIFGATPTLREVASELRALWGRDLFGALIRHRLSFSRSLLLPVTQLEKLHGASARTRRSVLGRGPELGGAMALTVAALALEAILGVGVVSLGLMMMPDAPGLDFDTILVTLETGEGPWWATALPITGWLMGVSLVEPVYVAAGFSLYLNRRTLLEGWDIELCFRRLARRVADRQRILSALFLALCLGGTSTARATPVGQPIPPVQLDESVDLNPTSDLVPDAHYTADEHPGPDPATADAVESAAETMFARPEFGYDKEVQRWALRDTQSFAGFDLQPLVDWIAGLGETAWLKDILEWLRSLLEGAETETPERDGWFGDGLSSIFEILMWSAVAILLAGGMLLAYRRRKTWLRFTPAPAETISPTRTTMGDIRGPQPVAAPKASIPDEVWSLWSTGQADASLSLLYNAALAQLTHSRDLELDPAWTEADCARAVRAGVGGTPARYFQRVVRARTRIAYAHRKPEDRIVRALCDDWPQLGSDA